MTFLEWKRERDRDRRAKRLALSPESVRPILAEIQAVKPPPYWYKRLYGDVALAVEFYGLDDHWLSWAEQHCTEGINKGKEGS